MRELDKMIIWSSGFAGAMSLNCFFKGDYFTGFLLMTTAVNVWLIGSMKR